MYVCMYVCMYVYLFMSMEILHQSRTMDDEVYRRLKDESTKAKQALEKAFQEKEAEKIKLQSIYKAMNKTEDELKTIFSEIESDKNTPSMPLHHEYHNLYWKWKNAENVHKNA